VRCAPLAKKGRGARNHEQQARAYYDFRDVNRDSHPNTLEVRRQQNSARNIEDSPEQYSHGYH
jgi:hypothetical protein